MAKTNSGLVAYAKAQVGKPYWYGTYGQTATESLYTSKKKQYPSYYTASDFSSQYGKRVHDCVGIIKGYLWSSSTTATPVYNSAQDWSAKGTYSKCTERGTISSFPAHAGMLVFKGTTASSIHHVGVYGGDGYVYEAKGHSYGVIKTKYKSSDWPFWAQHPYITDDTTSTSTSSSSSTTSTTTSTTTSSTTSSSSSSSSSSSGYTATLTVDGKWGPNTTKRLQTVLGTTVDGIVSAQDKSYKSANPGLKSTSWEWVSSSKATGSKMVKAMQKKLGTTQDGLIGPKTIKALQKRYGTTQDGYCSDPSAVVKALQRKLNAGTF